MFFHTQAPLVCYLLKGHALASAETAVGGELGGRGVEHTVRRESPPSSTAREECEKRAKKTKANNNEDSHRRKHITQPRCNHIKAAQCRITRWLGQPNRDARSATEQRCFCFVERLSHTHPSMSGTVT